MAQMGIFFDQTRCTGCYTCIVACKDWHDIEAGPAGLLRVKCIETGTFPDLFAAYLSIPCYHCEKPACAKVCPENAITKREDDGIVVVDTDKCLGLDECEATCKKACPWDAPCFGNEKNAKMIKCDLCLDRLADGRQTVCVEACPMFALDAGPIEELKEKYGAETQAEGFKYSKHLKPSVVFKPKKQPEKQPR